MFLPIFHSTATLVNSWSIVKDRCANRVLMCLLYGKFSQFRGEESSISILTYHFKSFINLFLFLKPKFSVSQICCQLQFIKKLTIVMMWVWFICSSKILCDWDLGPQGDCAWWQCGFFKEAWPSGRFLNYPDILWGAGGMGGVGGELSLKQTWTSPSFLYFHLKMWLSVGVGSALSPLLFTHKEGTASPKSLCWAICTSNIKISPTVSSISLLLLISKNK